MNFSPPRAFSLLLVLSVLLLQQFTGAPIRAEEDEEAIVAKELAAKEKIKQEKAAKEKAAKDAIDKANQEQSAKDAEAEKLRKSGVIIPRPYSMTNTKTFCAECLGLGIVPILPAIKPWLRVEPSKKPQPADDKIVTFKNCARCQKSANPKLIAEELLERQKKAREYGAELEKICGVKMGYLMSPHLTMHVEQPLVAGAATVAEDIEKLVMHFQKESKTECMSNGRPDTDGFVIIQSQKAWDAYIDHFGKGVADLAKIKEGDQFHLHGQMPRMYALKWDDIDAMKLMFFNSIMLAETVTGQKPPDWLVQALMLYAPYTLSGSVSMFPAVKGGAFKFERDVMRQAKTVGAKDKLTPLDELFKKPRASYDGTDTLTSIAFLGFLVKSDSVLNRAAPGQAVQASRFGKVILGLRTGATTTQALEDAFGAKMPEIKRMFVIWCGLK